MIEPRFTHAIARQVSSSLANCALTHQPRERIDVALARQQHQAYVDTLRALEIRVTVLPEEPALPDAVFVEDTAVILDELIVVALPGCIARRPEIASIVPVLKALRPLVFVETGTFDGGDALKIGRTLFVGYSSRTNREGARHLQSLLAPHSWKVVPVPIRGCLHLKSAVTHVAPGMVLANPRCVDVAPFSDLEVLTVPESEPWGANVLAVNGVLLVPASAPRTLDVLGSRGFDTRPVEISELQNAEAGLTCLRLLYRELK